MTDKTAFWRNPVLMLVFILPAVAIIAGVGLVVIAVRSGGSDSVTENVRRTAQIQTADLGPDAVAQRERLSAVMRVDVEQGLVEVLPVTGRYQRGEPLSLTLVHPARAAQDISLELAPSETGWRTEAEVDIAHDWNLRLAPADAGWRLQGRLVGGQFAAHLHPALQDAPDAP
ncbi:nitrogen fixation protein FixH [Luteimonas yindakuii]|uniref:Nitrogen fixation protein FixH n=1 Tax=Luteimonas yindakuii TaxID=2565782 RepID=A0A4Z1RJ27_9GAMM|nr:FixH family protein [Luteimonas yindakuii]QCO68324.1 nitrogen fixation protein FixH [Luteimonas yindakuii]TKS54727.1 nitrogen fixation protein FixH [Luteimonas yindakuii]